MAQASYSFLDVAGLDVVRQRFAAGDALVILSADLEEVIWANGPGAALFGHDDVEPIFGADAPLGAAAKRQIAALRGFPQIGQDKALLVRVTLGVSSEAVRFLASTVTLPDGERAILMAQPAIETEQHKALTRAIGGFSQPGHFIAFIDSAGAIEAATPGFERLGLPASTIAALAGESGDAQRVVKRLLEGRHGPLPAGLARLTENRSLVVVVDENWADDQGDSAQAEEPDPVGQVREIWQLGSHGFAAVEDEPAVVAKASVEDWSNAGPEDDAPKPAVALEPETIVRDDAESLAPALAMETEAAAEQAATSFEEVEVEEALEEEHPAPQQPASTERTIIGRTAAPARFVWRTDAEGRFSQVSTEFSGAVGAAAADVIGRRFCDVADAFGLDPTGEIAGLLARRDTWSGRTVSWPIAKTDLRVPVDLAALPVYDRGREFQGFRGFGVARVAEAAIDPAGTGLALPRIPLPEETVDDGAPAAKQDAWASTPDHVEAVAPEPIAETPHDPFQGEKPAIELTPVPDRRQSDKVIRLAEHRPPAQEHPPGGGRLLSPGERMAFQQIGDRLKREGAKATLQREDDKAAIQPPKRDTADEGKLHSQADEAGSTEAVTELLELDGTTGKSTEPTSGHGSQLQPAAEAETKTTLEAPRRKGERPGLSLLDFAKWEKDGAAEAAAQVEMEEAAEATKVALEPAEAVHEALSPTTTAETFPEASPDAKADGEAGGTEDAVHAEAPLTDADGTSETGNALFAETDFEPVEPSALEPVDYADSLAEAASRPSGRSDGGLSIIEKLPVPVLVHSGDVLHYANEEFFALTGYGSLAELANAGGLDALFVDPYEDENAQNDGEPQKRTDRHMRIRTQDDREFPVEAFLQSIPWDNGKALALVLSRIKDGVAGGQSSLIAQLEARVAEMRTIIDTATDGVVLIGANGHIRSISRPAEALFGMDSDEVAGKPFSSLFAIESQKAARDYLAGLTDNGVASVLNDGREVIGREAEGRFIPLFMTIGRLPGDSGFCAVVRDITQWKRAEEELTQARASAERASSHKSEFLARVSHEIRTPLNAIIGFSELMLDEKFGPVANDRYRDYLRDINRSGSHVLDLVNDLLDISKIEAGQQEMSYEAVSLNETLAETVALMQPQANRERVIIRSSFASKLPDVVADLRSVRQISLNILSNAIRYTQAGGQVIVSTAYESHGEVVMRVRDTGVGMTPAEIEQALKPFKQINSLQRTRGDGTGLGLPLTKAMVEANRAKFSIHSTPGEGTLVEIAFPSTRVLAD
ncbi:PAS domain S-box protein [Mesorhizobium sp. VNQ89]|uniref:PAS domain S-box protein n=1 Tax=Mesorhizobium quangtriensis TaxID=3157709 RepID=UPI0032B7C75E